MQRLLFAHAFFLAVVISHRPELCPQQFEPAAAASGSPARNARIIISANASVDVPYGAFGITTDGNGWYLEWQTESSARFSGEVFCPQTCVQSTIYFKSSPRGSVTVLTPYHLRLMQRRSEHAGAPGVPRNRAARGVFTANRRRKSDQSQDGVRFRSESVQRFRDAVRTGKQQRQQAVAVIVHSSRLAALVQLLRQFDRRQPESLLQFNRRILRNRFAQVRHRRLLCAVDFGPLCIRQTRRTEVRHRKRQFGMFGFFAGNHLQHPL